MTDAVRQRLPVYFVASLLLISTVAVASTLASMANPVPGPASQMQPYLVTHSQMESFVYTVVAGAGIAVVGAFWVLISFVTGRMEKSLDSHLTRLEQVVKGFGDAMSAHHSDPLAHPAGSAARINPINEKLDRIEKALTQLHTEHNIIRTGEHEICELVHALKGQKNRKRRDDPEDLDPTPLRNDP